MVELKEDRYGEYGVPDVKRKGCKLCPVKFKLDPMLTPAKLYGRCRWYYP